ncbi:MAG: GNAT family N-acetyltransferase [Geminicoccaceae bacterium]|nr:GNAT family N-acetyltransferase [Geminicoccaceae bacterium]
MHIEKFEDRDGIAALGPVWDRLYHEDEDALFFLSWPFMAQVLAQKDARWRVLVAREQGAEGRIIGLLPLRIDTFWSRSRRTWHNEVQLAGRHHWGQYNGFLCASSREAEVASAFGTYLATMPWSRMSMRYLHLSPRRRQAFLRPLEEAGTRIEEHEIRINKGTVDNLVCPHIELPSDYDAWLGSLASGNARQKLRRFARKVENDSELRLTVADASTLERDLDALIGLWTQKWAESTGAHTRRRAARYRHILTSLAAAGSLHLPVLWRGDRPLGAMGYAVDRQKPAVYFLIAGRDESEPLPFVGWALHAHGIRWAIENGARRYDFCHGDEAYKFAYGATRLRLSYVTVRRPGGRNPQGRLDPATFDDARAILADGRHTGDPRESGKAARALEVQRCQTVPRLSAGDPGSIARLP